MCVVVSYLQYETVNYKWLLNRILYVYKILKDLKKKTKKNSTKKNNTKSLDICCTLNGLFILNFVSISLVY